MQVALLVLGVGSLTVQFTGCTILGMAVGAHEDARAPRRYHPIERSRLRRVDPGSAVRLRLTDSTVVWGTYQGVVNEPGPSYPAAYDAWRTNEPAPTIALGAHVTIGRVHGRAGVGAFAGFDEVGVRYAGDAGAAKSVPWRNVARVVADSVDAPVARWRAAFADGTLPLAVQLSVQEPDGHVRTVDFGDVREVAVPARGYGVLEGAVVGLVMDAIVIHAVTRPQKQPDCGSVNPSYGGSF